MANFRPCRHTVDSKHGSTPGALPSNAPRPRGVFPASNSRPWLPNSGSQATPWSCELLRGLAGRPVDGAQLSRKRSGPLPRLTPFSASPTISNTCLPVTMPDWRVYLKKPRGRCTASCANWRCRETQRALAHPDPPDNLWKGRTFSVHQYPNPVNPARNPGHGHQGGRKDTERDCQLAE